MRNHWLFFFGLSAMVGISAEAFRRSAGVLDPVASEGTSSGALYPPPKPPTTGSSGALNPPPLPPTLVHKCLLENLPRKPADKCAKDACESLYQPGSKSKHLLYGTESAQSAYDKACPMNPLKYGLYRKKDAQNSGWRRNSAILLGKPRLVWSIRSNLRRIGIRRTLSGPLQLIYHLLYRKDPLEISFLLYADQCPLAEENYKYINSEDGLPFRTSEEYLVLYALMTVMKELREKQQTLSGGGTLKLVYVPEKENPEITDFRRVTPDEYLSAAEKSVLGTEEDLKIMKKKLVDFFRFESKRVNEDTTTRMKLHKMPKYVVDEDGVSLPKQTRSPISEIGDESTE